MGIQEYVYFNGEILPYQDVNVGLTDIGLLRGYSIFDFFPIRHGHPIFIEEYITRFLTSARNMRLPLDIEGQEIEKAIDQVIAKNNLQTGYGRLLLTGGNSSSGYLPEGRGNFIIIPYSDIHNPPALYEKGIKLISVDYVRQLPRTKTTNYARAIIERERVAAEGAYDVLFVGNGTISESSRANFFIVTEDDTVVTPKTSILEGITRKHLLQIANKNFAQEVRDLPYEALHSAKEAFISSTTKGALPVTQVDDIRIGTGTPGPITHTLNKAYWAEVDQYAKDRQP